MALETIGYIDLESKSPKIYTRKSNFTVAKNKRIAAEQAKAEAIAAEQKQRYNESIEQWKERVKIQQHNSLLNRIEKLSEKFVVKPLK